MPMPKPLRRGTAHSAIPMGIVKRLSFPRRNQILSMPLPSSKYREYYVPTYLLPWDKLREWLVARFPTMEESYTEKISDNKFVFIVPRVLTQAELGEILHLYLKDNDGEERDPDRLSESDEDT